ncbi:hypothetical protein HYC85_019479 [Camellia sinensis]|uniref:Fe2OG dioxygenase domain-containing protein n=1 Tax=Camellia sinensis TaxID=4442 RepID=A0A7J7GMW0_CAMSI|nr:hypothetical protein HYC85_019479 [Camellia sinensis]
MDYDREKELKAFDDSKAGVKGLIDAGVDKDELAEELNRCQAGLQVPIINLSGIEIGNRREEVVHQVRAASEKWGFFQVVNHGIPQSVLDEMIDGIRMFHEQDPEVKKAIYTRDRIKRVRFESNYDLYRSRSANWRDTLTISMLVSDHLEPDEFPTSCRATTIEYIKNAIECGRGRTFVCHYYPTCPEPELTLGASKHSDPAFLTVLLQDQLGGLQVMHQNQWVDVQPIHGGLVVNIGDLLQIISNDKFRSVDHRVLANNVGPRISVASFFKGVFGTPKLYGPIKELITEENPPLYRDFLVSDYIGKFMSRALDESGLDHFKL